MPDQTVSRRTVAIALAGGALGAKLASVDSLAHPHDDAGAPARDAAAGGAHAPAGAGPDGAAHPQGPTERVLLAPLTEGARLLSWEVVAIEPMEFGAARVRLRGDAGDTFAIEILARDRSPLAARPPAQTDRFALHVSNGGDGRSPTAEEQGLAAMALVQIVARNEAHVPAGGFLTHAERIAAYPGALLDHVDGSTLPGPPDPTVRSA